MICNKLEGFNTKLSQLGLGCWKYDDDWGYAFERKMVKILQRALDKGITLFDTAPIYGLGRSEEILGKAIRKERKNIVISTKVGLVWEKREKFIKVKDCSPANIKKEIDMSLKRLKTDYIDFYLIHWPDPNTPIEDTLLTMEHLKNSGKILHIGLCNCSLNLLKKALKYSKIDAIQVSYSLIDRKIESGLLPFCKEKDILVFAYGSLGKGLLTGMYNKDTKFTIDYHRKKDKNFQGKTLLRNFKILEAVKYIANQLKKTPAQIAVRWVLENPYVAMAIFGVDSISQLQGNILAADFTLSKENIDFLNKASRFK